MIDRTERAFTAHRDALQEILDHGINADQGYILDSLTTINKWGDRDQRADLTSEILDAYEAGKLDDTALRSLSQTLEYLTPDAPDEQRDYALEYLTPDAPDEQRDYAEEAYNAQLMREE